MKTTIEIADDLLKRAQRVARQEKSTLSELVEKGLRLVLSEKKAKSKELPPLVTVCGSGLTKEFRKAPWKTIRNKIYEGRGA